MKIKASLLIVVLGAGALSACSSAGSLMSGASGLGGGTGVEPATFGTSSNPGPPASAGAAANTLAQPNAPGNANVQHTDSATPAAASSSPAAVALKGPVANPYPFGLGDSVQFTYAASHSAEVPGKTGTATSTTGVLTDTIGAVVSFNGQQLTDVKESLSYKETDAAQKTVSSGTTTTDRFETFAQAENGGLLFETAGRTIAGNATGSAGESITSASNVSYAAPYVIDELPGSKGAHWIDALGYTLIAQTQTTKAGVVSAGRTTYTRNSDGSYSRTTVHAVAGGTAVKQEETQAANGSGSERDDSAGPNAGTTTFAAPAQVAGGSANAISVVHTPPGGTPVTTSVPDWFPGNAPAAKLTSDQRVDLGSVAVPAKCGASAGETARQVREVSSELDVVRGTFAAEEVDQFVVPGQGTVCLDRQRRVNAYDNRATGKLLGVERFTETTGLTAESLARLRARQSPATH